jgi:hypothetical protein
MADLPRIVAAARWDAALGNAARVGTSTFSFAPLRLEIKSHHP